MMIGKIKYSFPELSSLFRLNEGVEVISAICMLLLSNDILSDSVLLLEIDECRLWTDVTLWIS